jgi:hypothetical protein
MPPSLLDALIQWSDIQAVLARCSSSEVAFKYPIARRMLSVVASLYKWHRQRINAVKWLALVPAAEVSASSLASGAGGGSSAGSMEGGGFTVANLLGEEEGEGEELIAGTDGGNEEASDNEFEETAASVGIIGQEQGQVHAEPDTETEFPLELQEIEGELPQDQNHELLDSDNEGDLYMPMHF